MQKNKEQFDINIKNKNERIDTIREEIQEINAYLSRGQLGIADTVFNRIMNNETSSQDAVERSVIFNSPKYK